jgi:thymidylate synthase (FAD)
MRLIKPNYEIITPIDGEQIIYDMEIAARNCYKSEGNITTIKIHDELQDATSGKKLIDKLIKRKHFAMIEFGQDITVRFIVDRGVSHELVRHRMASFAQESTRYVDYKDKPMEFIIPPWIDLKEGTYIGTKNNQSWFKEGENQALHIKDKGTYRWLETMYDASLTYHILRTNAKWSPQQARSVLPNSLKTEILVKANLREWRHIFTLRTAHAAHPQMYEMMRPLLAELKKKIPIVFDDIDWENNKLTLEQAIKQLNEQNDRLDTLLALEHAGVDNWEGYSVAMDLKEEMQNG